MKVAFLITVYKNDKLSFFEEAINSIVQQSYGFSNINIYLGIDGVLGKSLECYIEENHTLFHKVIRNQKNKGLAFTLNRLIDSLEDESFVFRMDSDDVCYPHRADIQLTFLQKNPKVLICGGSIEEFDESGKINMVRTYPTDTKAAKKYIYKASIFAHPAVCFRRELFQKGFRYNAEYRFSQDLALWFEVLKEGVEVGNVKEVVLKLRVTSDFYQRRSRRKAMGEFCIYYRGIIQNYGFGVKLLYPIFRLFTRLMPTFVVKLLYNGGLRNILNQRK